MCELEPLLKSESDYIGYCNNCQSFRICYGNFALSLTNKDFYVLKKLVAEMVENQIDFPDSSVRDLMIPTPYPSVFLFLSIDELEQLNNLLEKAVEELTVRELMGLFTPNSN